MLGTVFYVAMAACGIEVGWVPDAQGELQYTIQIEPEMVDTLRAGRPIEYNLPPEHRGVHRFRFQVGRGKLPRVDAPPSSPAAETASPRPERTLAPPWGSEVGWAADAQGELRYTIQVQPETIDTLRAGRPIEYDLPPEHRGVHRFRFQVGRGKLPQEGNPAPPPARQAATPRPEPSPKSYPVSGAGWNTIAPEKQSAPQTSPAVTLPDNPPKLELPTPKDAPDIDDASLAATAPSAPRDVPPRTHGALPGASQESPSPSTEESAVAFQQPMLANKLPTPSSSSAPAEENLRVPLVLTSCTAAGLLAACLYLCWVYAGTRRRYRALLADYYAAVGSLPGFATATDAEEEA